MKSEWEAARRHYHRRQAERRAELEAERQRWLGRVRESIADLAPAHPGVRQVFVFGSLLQPGRFRPDSDIDLALDCDTLAIESAFWRALERELGRDVDLRPLEGPVAESVARDGERIYG